MNYRINTPFSAEELKMLRAGDNVLLSGTVYTSRDAAHKRTVEAIECGDELPFDIKNSAVYYVGPTPEHDGLAIGSAGPTTSCRMDAYSPTLLDLGQTVMIGKGDRSETVIEAIKRNGAVYLAAAGGAGALMGASVEAAELVCWEDLGCEAVRKLTVRDMPLTVAIDSEGNDIYKLGRNAYLESLK